MAFKLKAKLLLPTLLLFVLSLSVSGWYAYSVAREQLRESVGETLAAYGAALGFALDDVASNIVQDLQGIGIIPPVMAILAIQDNPQSPRFKALQEELDYSLSTRTLVGNGTYGHLALLNRDGQTIASSHAECHKSVTPQNPAYAQALATGLPQLGAPEPQLPLPGGELPPGPVPTGQTYVPFYVPVLHEGKVVGCVYAYLDFTQVAARLTARIAVDSGYAIIMGAAGQMMHHPNSDLVMEPVDFASMDADDPSSHMVRQHEGILQYEWEGSPWLAIFRTGEFSHWTSAVKVDLDRLYDPVTVVQRQILSVNVLWMVLFAVCVTMLGQYIVSNLLRTIDYARRVSEGALDEELTVRSGDEVGILADSLRSMVQSLRATLARSMEQQRQLERISQHKTDFVSNISHEIRTPMNALMGFLTLFRRDNLDTQQCDYMEKIDVASRAILQIVNDVLDLAKIEQGKLDMERIVFAPRQVVDAIGGVIAFSTEAKGCRYHCRVDAAVPEHVLGDPTRLQQVLFNLLGNAVKFTAEGEVRLNVKLLTLSRDKAGLQQAKLLFEVRDTGIGLSREQLSLLFTPFSQADASITRQFGGTGLGLTISKKLVELMGGEISVDSTPGQGSSFRFTIHAALPTDADRLPAPEAVGPVASVSALQGKRVLVVEDNPINQEIICAMLESLGISQCVLAANGQEALNEVGRQRFDVILMDMQMPIMDGVTATEHLRRRGAEEPWLAVVPIVALTANALSTDVDRCLAAGMNAHISKPIMLDVLRETLLAQVVGDGEDGTGPAPPAGTGSGSDTGPGSGMGAGPGSGRGAGTGGPPA